MNKEEIIEYLKNLIKNPTISQDPFYTTKIAIDTVLNYIEKLENMYNKEYNEHIEMKRQNGVLRNNERILKEKVEELENKLDKQKQLTKLAETITDESIREALEEFIKDYIPKQKIRDKIEELEKNELMGKVYFEQIKFTIDILEELLGE